MHPERFAHLQPSALFHDRYRVVRCIKAGGMGVVYEVVDESTSAPRALKVMLPGVVDNPDHRARFAREAKVTGSVESDHVVRVTDAGIDAATGMPFIAMELLRGEELADIVVKRRTLPPGEVVTYLWQAALALDKTHAAGIVHRDLKPENLFVTRRDDGTPCVKIFDFGIAKVVTGDQAPKTRALGTPLYMAPEQIRGATRAIGPRADLYTLGHIAYAALAGEAYWVEEGEASEEIFPLLLKIAAGPKEPPVARALRRTGATLPAGFDAWFLRAAAARADDRFERATTMIAALAEALGVPSPGPVAPLSSAVTADHEPVASLPTPVGPGLTVKIGPDTGAHASPSAVAATGPVTMGETRANERTESIDVVVGKAAAPGSRSATAFAMGAMAVLAVGGVAFGLLRGQGAVPGSAAATGAPAAPVVVASVSASSVETASAPPPATTSAVPVPAPSTSAAPPAGRPVRKTAAPGKALDQGTAPKAEKEGIF